ncbi:MAG: pyridoxal-phosphate dependent enzyme [bacterium]|nr:pyridoxal-phosphate dependent enzyme [bacterium]
MTRPTIDDVRAAAKRIEGHVHRTPVMTSRTLDDELGASVFFKCENFQKVGAFKARGACNAVFALDDEAAARGVVTHSSGNHGAALAYAASRRGVRCTVVMPDDAPPIKVDAVRGYGAEIVLCKRAERETTCDRVLSETGASLIHPYENPYVVAGQGTAALELIEEVGDLDLVLAPVGGGGLLSGTAVTVSVLLPDAVVRGAEPEMVDDAARSLATGALQPAVRPPNSICDGLLTGLGKLAFSLLRERDVTVVTVSDDEVVEAARWILQRMKIVVEPSGATVIAALRRIPADVAGKRIGAIFSGGNTDMAWLAR